MSRCASVIQYLSCLGSIMLWVTHEPVREVRALYEQRDVETSWFGGATPRESSLMSVSRDFAPRSLAALVSNNMTAPVNTHISANQCC